tara:strand:+ start:9690 stop:9872 length:183 start_codon:yes stop_codon:yes gene_type:complete
MGIKGYFRLKKHTQYMYSRVLEIRREILIEAIEDRKIDDLKVELFLKYNRRLVLLEKYSF